MEIRVQLFAGLRQRAGTSELIVDLDGERPTVADAVSAVERELPALSGILDSVARAVDEEIVTDDHRLREGSVLALLPPVSGGNAASHRWLSAKPLDRDALIDETSDDRSGALVIFSGDIRSHNDGRDDVIAIEYEAHHSMAASVLEKIEKEVCSQFDVLGCRVQHRLGRVEVGQSSVLVVCRAAHRDDAFAGARYAIDELKVRTPIWKREFYADGSDRYLDGTPLEKS